MQNENNNLAIYSRLLGYLKSLKTLLFSGIFFSILFALVSPALAHLIKLFIEALEKDLSNPWMLYSIPAGVFILALVRSISSFASRYFIGRTGATVVHQIRCDMFDAMLKLPTSYFDNNDTGRLVSKLTYDVEQINNSVSHVLTKVLQDGLVVIFLLSYMIWLNVMLTSIFMVIGIPLAYLASIVGKRIRRIATDMQSTIGSVTQVAKEVLGGIPLIRSFNGYHTESERFRHISQINFKQSMKFLRTLAAASPIATVIIILGLAVIMLVILLLKDTSNTTSAEFIVFIVTCAALPTPIRTLGDVYGQIMKSISAAESIFNIIDTPQEPNLGTFKVQSVQGNLLFDNVNFIYPHTHQPVLNNVSLTIKAGQTIAIVGRSGSGKSTLTKLVSRLYPLTQGQILLDNIPIEQYDLVNLRSHIALVSQKIILFNDSVRANIAYGCLHDISEANIINAAKLSYAHDFIMQLPNAYDTIVGENATLLSGGQRQRIAIARSFLKDAPVLILDEATSSLANDSERFIQHSLTQLMKNRTTIIVAHRLSTVQTADLIVFMDKGSVMETGTHEQLLKNNSFYKNLYNKGLQDIEGSKKD